MAESLRSIPDLFVDRIARTPDREAFRHPVAGEWKSLTWRDTGARVRGIACGLLSLGLQREQRCAILSGTRLEWILVDLGILCAGGVTTTIYPSNTAEECTYILKDSATRFVFAENQGQLDKLKTKRAELGGVDRVILLDGEPKDDWGLSLAKLEEQGRAWDAANPGKYDATVKGADKSQLATLVYTSGTTGQPKGVELTHDCWVYEGECIDALKLLAEDDLQYLWLPLSHVFGKVLEAAQLKIGFATAVDGRVDKLVDNLAVIRPTFVAAVPRIFEKVHNKVVTSTLEAGGLKATIFSWAVRIGKQYSRLERSGKRPGAWLSLQRGIADKLVFSKLRDRFGGRLRFFVSGSAPLSLDVAEFFHAAGILICEGYGLTESSAASFVNRPEAYSLGTVGLPLPGTEIKLAESDQEILIRGRGIMRGYHKLPEATAASLDKDGWLHTGDIGVVDDKGFLKITDRKKDLIKTSGGKYVAPQALEGKLKALCPYISQVVVHGDNRNFCSALVTLDEEAVRNWSQDHGLGQLKLPELATHDQVRKLVQTAIDELNSGLASYESIKKFAILPADLTQEAGELTPSMKVKRKAVEQKYRSILDGFYEGALARV